MTIIDPVQQSLKAWNYEQDNRLRLQNYKVMESYHDGTFDQDQLTQITDKLKKNHIVAPRIAEALQSDFRVICNYAKTVVNKAVGYLCADPISIEVKPDLLGLEDTEGLDEKQLEINKKDRQARKIVAKNAERILYSVYKKNNFLHKHIIKLIRIQAKKGECFVKVWIDSTGSIRLTLLKPDIVFPKMGTEEDFEAFEHVAIIYDRPDGKGTTEKYAQVWWPDVWREYVSPANTQTWTKIGKDHPNDIGIIPIVHIKNTHDEKPWGESDIECIITLIDAMCKAFTDLMVNADYQAFQRVITTGFSGASIRITETTEKKTVDTGPGSMLNIPAADAKVYVVEPSDPVGLISIIKEIRQEISAHARIPQIALSVADGAGAASSLSLRIHYQPLDEKCNEKAALASAGLEDVNKIILAYHKLLKKEDFTELESKVTFSKSLPADKAEDSTIQDTQIRNSLLSKETAMQQNGIEDVEAEKEIIAKETEASLQIDYTSRLQQEMAGALGQSAVNSGGK